MNTNSQGGKKAFVLRDEQGNNSIPNQQNGYSASTDNQQSFDFSQYREADKASNDTSVSTNKQQENRPLTKPFVKDSERKKDWSDEDFMHPDNSAPVSQQTISADKTKPLEKPFVSRADGASNNTLTPTSQHYFQSEPIPQRDIEDSLTDRPKGSIKVTVDKIEKQEELINSIQRDRASVSQTSQDNRRSLANNPNGSVTTPPKNNNLTQFIKIPPKEATPIKENVDEAIDVAAELAKYFNFVKFEDELYFFNREHNHYEKCPPKMLERIVYDIYKNSSLKRKGPTFFKTICKYLSLEAESPKYISEDFFDIKNYIGFKNGYLDLYSAIFYPPKPDKFIANYLEINYDQQYASKLLHEEIDLRSICCPHFDNFIWRMANGNPEIFERIFQIIGYVITNDISAKKLFVLGRARDSGKSKLCEFIGSLFNKDAVTSIPLAELGDKFVAGELQGKSLCIDADLQACKIRNKTSAAIKSYTGNDLISSAVKFQGRKKFKNLAKFIFATNYLIEIGPREDALKERFVYIPIVNTVPPEERIFDILKLFEPEKFMIVMKSIGYYLELRANDYKFSGDFPLDDIIYCETPVSVAISEMKKNTIENFVRQRCLLNDFNSFTPTSILYETYCNFCDVTGDEIAEYNNFSKILNQLCRGKVEKVKKRVDGYNSAISVYRGIVLNEAHYANS